MKTFGKRDRHLDADQPCLVSQQVDKPCVRDLDKRLVIFAPQLHFLFPKTVLANDDGPDSLFDEQIKRIKALRPPEAFATLDFKIFTGEQ